MQCNRRNEKASRKALKGQGIVHVADLHEAFDTKEHLIHYSLSSC